MIVRQFSFGEVSIVDTNIAELVVAEDVEVSLDMVQEYFDFLNEHIEYPFSILLNKLNTYSYSFEAFKELGFSEHFKNIAVVSYSKVSTGVSNYLIGRASNTNVVVEMFDDRESALAWLQSQLA